MRSHSDCAIARANPDATLALTLTLTLTLTLEVDGPFTADFFALHTDAMKDVYPSRHAEDLTWQKIGLVTGGEAPPPRTKASLVAWGNALLLFGGLADHNGEAAWSKCRLPMS